MSRLLFINHNMHYGGAQRVLINLLKEIAIREDLFITLYLLEYDGTFLQELPNNIEVKYLTYSTRRILTEKTFLKLPKKLLLSVFRRIISDKMFSRFVRTYYLNEHYDVEISVKEGISKIMLAESKNKNSHKIMWVHTDLRMFKGISKNDLYYYSKADKIICVSENVREGFEHKYPQLASKVYVVNNVINKEDIIKKSLEGHDPYKHDYLNVINVGRLSKEKAQHRLIKVHKQLLDQGIFHYLHIIGEGDERRNLEKLIKDFGLKTVILWGAKENPYIYLKHADIYVHSSINEGLPTVLYEGIYLNLPIASTDVSGVREILEDGKFGLIMDNTYEGFIYGYKKILTDVHLREKLIKNTFVFKDNNQKNISKYLEIILCREDSPWK
ncbi:MAG: glycosyltransferase [Eubacteriaceae bacterium]